MKVWITVVVVAFLCVGCACGRVDGHPERIRVAVVTGGHAFDRGSFLQVFEGHADIEYVHLPQKDHSELFEDIRQWPYDVIVLYNMTQEISERRRRNFIALLDQGVGLVVLHHAIAAFRTWPEFEDIIGASYFLEDTVVDGVIHKASRPTHDVDFPIYIQDPRHPITRGLRDFRVHDETYKGFLCDPGNHVLLTTDDPASDRAVCWVRTYRKANVCYIQMGHGPSTYANENYRRLVVGAIRWATRRLKENVADRRGIFAQPAVRASAKPARVTFAVDGPIPLRRTIPLVWPSSHFIAPHEVELVKETSDARVMVSFMFLGEEDPDRLIRLTVVLIDSAGNKLATMTRNCNDQRIPARETWVETNVVRLNPRNGENFPIDVGMVDRIDRIELMFEES